MNEPIDWSKPICLDTVPPRMAILSETQQNGAIGNVWASWRGERHVTSFWVRYDGMPEISNLPTVRNVRPGDFPATPATDIAAELADALRFYGGHDPNNSDHGDWVERMNEDGGDVARATLAKWEASQ